MYVQNLSQPFEIHHIKTNECPVQTHKHTFFELIYITEGQGMHFINGNELAYSQGQLLLIPPMSLHYFTVKEMTTFVIIAFNNIYLDKQKEQWSQKLEYIFHNNHTPGNVIRSERERILVSALIENILGEYDQQQEYNKHLIQQLVNTIITVVAKNVFASISTQNCNKENNAYNIINYIHTNIYEPEKLRADHLAAHFHISPNYISEYFKKETGENLQQYIINYKLSLVATRLKHSDMRLNEIAFELGFSDESHLTKLFRKYRGITPAAYRKLSH